MRKTILGLGFLLLLSPAVGLAQSQWTESGKLAFDVTKADIDTILKKMPPQGATDQLLRIVDMGKYNLAVGVVYRGPTTDKPGDPTTGTYHDQVAEIYIVLSGSGILTTGGSKDKKPRPEYLLPTGPGGSGTVGPGAYSRKVQTGDIVLIPPGVLHAWSKITDHVTYLSMRPDPERALPGGYVNPLLMNNSPAPAP